MPISADEARKELARRELAKRKEIPADVPDIELMELAPQTPPKTTGEKFVRDLPAMVGGIAGPLIASKAGPIARMGAAAIGGVLGEGAVITHDLLRDDPSKPETPSEAFAQLGRAGGEQAVFEGIAQLASKAFLALRAKGADKRAAKEALASKFGEFGGEFTSAQKSDSWLIKQADSLARGSITGSGPFKTRDLLNEQAFKLMAEDLPKTVAFRAKGTLDSAAIGDLFLNTVRGGRAAHSAAGGELYRAVDTIAANTGTTVNVAPLKRLVEAKLRKAQEISMIGVGKEQKEVMGAVLQLPDRMTFANASNLRSAVLAMQRDMADAYGKGAAKAFVGETADVLTNSMTKAASKGEGELLTAYARANKFWKTGKETFNNRFISGLLKETTNVEEIGKRVFKMNNVSSILKAKKAVKTAGALDKSIDSQKVWHSMQTGFLEDILTKNTSADGVVNAKALLRLFENKRSAETLRAAFTKQQRDAIHSFAQIGAITQGKAEGNLGMVMQLSQAGAFVKMISMKAAATAGEIGTLFIAPRAMAKIMTNPKWTDWMTKAIVTQTALKVPQELRLLIEEENKKEQ